MTEKLEMTDLAWPDGRQRRFFHRGSKADVGVSRQIFASQDYSLQRLARGAEILAFYRSLVSAHRKPFIVDAGANIGASACWFAMEYPDAEVIAIEPDPQNFEILKMNSAGLHVEARNAAIGSRDGRVSVVDPGEGEWGYRTKVDDLGNCDMISMARLIQGKVDGGATPFIVKIDIEGGEADLFQEPNDWVDRVPLLIVELHDWLLPKQRTSLPFLKCIAKHDRDFVYIGENIFSIRNEL